MNQPNAGYANFAVLVESLLPIIDVNGGDVDAVGFSKLHQWQLWQEELKSDVRIPLALRDKCQKAMISALTFSSDLQADVIFELLSIGLRPEEKFLINTGYRLDALVEVNGMKVGVEVDGPYHFFGRVVNGKTLLKRRQVTSLDEITVVSAPYWEWNDLGKGREKKHEYLRGLLCFE